MKLLLTFLLACWPLVAVDLIYIAGCETAAIEAEWDVFASATCTATRVKNGNYAIEQATSDLSTIDLGAITEIWLRFDVQIDVLPTVTATSLKLRDGASVSFLVMDVDTDGSIGIEGTTSTFDMVVDTFYLFEVHYKKGTGANGEYHLWVDGTEEIAVTNSALTDDVHFINPEAFGDGGTFMDNFAASTVGRIGDGQSVALRPNADASPDTFDVTTGSQPSWDDVDDDPCCGTSRARAPTAGTPPVGQEWDLTTEASIGTINTVSIIVNALRTDGGEGSETVRPDAVNDVVNYTTCTINEINDDPDSDDGEFCDGLATDVDADADAEFATPSASPSSTTNAQEIRACFISTGEASDPTCTVSIMEGNTVRIANIINTAISQTTCAAVQSATFTFDPAVWTDDTGAALAARTECTAGGGSPAGRASGELGAIEWNVSTASTTTHKLIANDDNNSDLLLGPDLGLTGTFDYYSLIVTGAAVPVSQADVDAYEIGLEQSASDNPKATINAIWFMIDHDAVVAGGGKRRTMVSLIGTLNLMGLQ